MSTTTATLTKNLRKHLTAYADTLSGFDRMNVLRLIDDSVSAVDMLPVFRDAWTNICDAMDSVDPDWMMHGKEGVDAVVAHIKQQPQQDDQIKWPDRMVNMACPDGSDDRIIGFRVSDGDPILGAYGMSEPLSWLRRVTVDRYENPK